MRDCTITILRLLPALLLGATLLSPPAKALASGVPIIESLSQTTVRAGEVVKVTGRGFLPRELWYGGPPIYIGDSYAWVEGWADDRIYARALLDTEPGIHELWLRIGHVPSRRVPILILPAIDRVEVDRVDHSDVIMVHGGAFGKRPGRVLLGGRKVAPILWTTTLLILPPAGVAGETTLTVEKNGYTASHRFELPFTLSHLLVDPGLAETRVLVQGDRFGTRRGYGEVRIGNSPVTLRQWDEDEIVGVIAPELPAGRHSVFVRVGSATDVLAPIEIVPVIRALDYARGGPGDAVELYGAHFPLDGTQAQVTVGGLPAPILAATPQMLRIRLPHNLDPGDHVIRVTVLDGRPSPGVIFHVLAEGRQVVRYEEFGDGW